MRADIIRFQEDRGISWNSASQEFEAMDESSSENSLRAMLRQWREWSAGEWCDQIAAARQSAESLAADSGDEAQAIPSYGGGEGDPEGAEQDVDSEDGCEPAEDDQEDVLQCGIS